MSYLRQLHGIHLIRNRVSYDIWQAQDIKNYKFYGIAAHAARFPEKGRSALERLN